jgi:hypothetical protein
MCSRCNEAGRFELCEACRARVGADDAFAFRRDRIVWGELLGFSLRLYKQNFGLMTLTMIAAGAPFVLGQLASYAVQALFVDQLLLAVALSMLLLIVQTVAQGVITLGTLDICVRLARGNPADLGMLLGGFRRLGALLLQGLVTNFAVMFAALCATAPVIAVFVLSNEPALPTIGVAALVALVGAGFVVYLALGFSFATFELVAEPRLDAFDSIRNSWAIARGERLTVFVALVIVGLLAFAGALVCLVGLIFTLGYATLLFSVLYLALRNGAKLPR